MIATCKKLVTDIQRDKDLDTKLPEYAELLGRQYNCYATVKGSMNHYTMSRKTRTWMSANILHF